MAEKFSFTMAALTRLALPETGRRWVYDTKVAGLGMCLTPAGNRSFYWYRKVDGRPERVFIGGFPELSVDDARKVAEQHNVMRANGNNPATAKRKRRGELTLGELRKLYVEIHAAPHKKPNSLKADEGIWQRYLLPWQHHKLSSIERRDVQVLHMAIGRDHGHYAANRTVGLLRSMFTIATDLGEWDKINPCRKIKEFAEESRDRFLQADEMPKFFKALDEAENQDIADVLRLLLFVGARKMNTLAMRWDELTLSAGTWRIPDTKSNEPQIVHLPAVAIEILEKRRATAGNSPYVFPVNRTGTKCGHLTVIAKAWKGILKSAGITGLRPHDLRRSLGSWMAAGGTSLQIIGKTLGHKDITTTQIYSRVSVAPIRVAVDSAVAAMLATVSTATEGGGR